MSDEMIVSLVLIVALFCVFVYLVNKNTQLQRENDALRKELMSNYRNAKDKQWMK